MRTLRPCLIVLVCLLIMAGCTPAATPPPTPEPLTSPPPTPAPPTAVPPIAEPPTAVPPIEEPPVIPADPIEVVNAWTAALNSGDIETALAYFTDNAKYTLGENATGKPALRNLFEWLVAMETRWDPPDCKPLGSDAQCSFHTTDGCLAALRYEKEKLTPSKATITFVDGRIRMVGGSAAGSEGPGRGIIYDDAVAMRVQQQHPDEFRKIVTDYNPGSYSHAISRLAHSQEAAAIALRLCKEYAETPKK